MLDNSPGNRPPGITRENSWTDATFSKLPALSLRARPSPAPLSPTPPPSRACPGTAGSSHESELAIQPNSRGRRARARFRRLRLRARRHSSHQRRLPWHSFDEKSYEFVSSYRRRFKLPAEARGQRVFVDFEGAMTASTVWINGAAAGRIQRRLHAFLF